MARSIEEATRTAAENGGAAMVRNPFKGAANPFGKAGEVNDGLIDGILGQGGDQGQGQGQGDGAAQDGEGANGDESLEDRRPPLAYPAPPAPLPP